MRPRTMSSLVSAALLLLLTVALAPACGGEDDQPGDTTVADTPSEDTVAPLDSATDTALDVATDTPSEPTDTLLGDGDDTSPDDVEGEAEVTGPPPLPMEPSASYQDRQAEYLQYCVDNTGPDSGGLSSVVCHVAVGSSDYHEAEIADALTFIEERNDVSDFKVTSLLRILYLDKETGALADDTRQAIVDTVLGFKYWIDEPGEDKMCFWSENHQILYHQCELLAGQLFPDEVFSNSGMTGAEHVAHATPLIERWLYLRGTIGFSEWHSNVYFNEDMPPLVNLVDFAEDESIRTKAAAILDILAYDMATNYYKGIFATVHGRTYNSKFIDGLVDSTREAAWIMLGLGEYQSKDNFTATHLATSSYFTPYVLEDIALEASPSLEHKQRDGIMVEEGPDHGIGYEGLDDFIVWAGMSAIAAPPTIEGGLEVVDEYGLWDNFLFGDLPDDILMMAKGLVGTPGAADLSEQVEVISVGIALEGMDTYVYRTPHYQLAGAQSYNPTFFGAQTQMWLATLDAESYVFTSFPSGMSSEEGFELSFGGEWIGSWMPRGTLYKNVGVFQYVLPEIPSIIAGYLSSDHVHAFFPKDTFDELVEQDGWTIGKKGDGYVALWSQHPTYWSEEHSYELISDVTDNVWIVELGSSDEYADFGAFVAAITAAPVSVEDGVTSYESPSQGPVSVGWEGPMTVDGVEVDLGPYPRWDNPYGTTEHGSPVTTITHDGVSLVIDMDAGTRQLFEATAD